MKSQVNSFGGDPLRNMEKLSGITGRLNGDVGQGFKDHGQRRGALDADLVPADPGEIWLKLGGEVHLGEVK